MYVEYKNPNPDLVDGLKQVYDAGFNSVNPGEALAKRTLVLRMFIQKWETRLTNGFKEKLYLIASYALPPKDERPELPDPRAFSGLSTPEGFGKFWAEIQDAWERMRIYFESKKYEQPQKVTPPMDRYVAMTAGLRDLLEGVSPKNSKRMETPNAKYAFMEDSRFPGHLVVKVTDEKDIQFFREREKASEKNESNLPRWKCYDELPVVDEESQMAIKNALRESTKDSEVDFDEDASNVMLADMATRPYSKTELTRAKRDMVTAIAIAKMGPRDYLSELSKDEIVLEILKHQAEVENLKEKMEAAEDDSQ